jgi:hypothetical protein
MFRSILRDRKHFCIEPQVGQLLDDAISGALNRLGREEALWCFKSHIRDCVSCHNKLLDKANEQVTLPTIKRIAEERGITFEVVVKSLSEYDSE